MKDGDDMAKRYYLTNGENGTASGITFKVNGILKRDFDDITDVDLQTIQIPYNKAVETLQKYNERIEFKQNFFDAEFPYRENEVKTSPALFEYNNKELYGFYKTLIHQAELRSAQKKAGKSVILEDSKELKDYYYGLMYKIISTKDSRFYSRSSLIGKELKNKICERMIGKEHIRIEDYISYILNSDMINGMLHNYTQLKALFIEYANYLNQLPYYVSRNAYQTYDTYNFTNLEPYHEDYGTQMNIFDLLKDIDEREAQQQQTKK